MRSRVYPFEMTRKRKYEDCADRQAKKPFRSPFSVSQRESCVAAADKTAQAIGIQTQQGKDHQLFLDPSTSILEPTKTAWIC